MIGLFTFLTVAISVLLTSQPAIASATPSVLIPLLFSSPIDPNDIPSQCQPQCTSILNDAATCKTIECLCTDANSDKLAQCFDCLLTIDNSSGLQETAQGVFDQFVGECKAGGSPVKSNKISASSASSGATTTTVELGMFSVILGTAAFLLT